VIAHRIIPASQLRAGPATIIVALGDRTIRSRAVIVIAEPHGIVRVAFDSGDILSLSSRSALGVIDPSVPTRLLAAAPGTRDQATTRVGPSQGPTSVCIGNGVRSRSRVPRLYFRRASSLRFGLP
jgi:hypothetical protein